MKPFDPNFGAEEAQASSTDRFRKYQMDDLDGLPSPKWLLPHLLMEKQIGCIYGAPATFKSFTLIALCSMLVYGLPWQGGFLRKRRVLYVAGEGFRSFGLRRNAWFRYHSIIKPKIDGLVVMNEVFPLSAPDDFIKAALLEDEPYDLIVFDTLSVFTAGQDESDSGMMTGTIEGAKKVAAECDSAVLLVHHTGKDESREARGHSSLSGNVDAMLKLTRNTDSEFCDIEVKKQKDGEQGAKFGFKANKVMLGGIDPDSGLEMSSIAMSALGERPNVPPKPSQEEQAVLDRITIASKMRDGETISRRGLALKLLSSGLRSNHAVLDMIDAALTEEWQSTRDGDGVICEIRMLAQKKQGGSATIERRDVR